MPNPLDDTSLDQLFRLARTYGGSTKAWLDQPVDEEQLRRAYELARMGPTSANCCPARLVFVRSAEAKARLRAVLDDGNVERTMAAPVTVIIGSDYAFYDKLPQLFPHTDARSWFAGKPALIETTAFRNASLQGAYLILAARALGFDTGPMSGFDNAAVDAAFFAGTAIKSNFITTLGHGDASTIFGRLPRPPFDRFNSVR